MFGSFVLLAGIVHYITSYLSIHVHVYTPNDELLLYISSPKDYNSIKKHTDTCKLDNFFDCVYANYMYPFKVNEWGRHTYKERINNYKLRWLDIVISAANW